jgi:hypothetical protein
MGETLGVEWLFTGETTAHSGVKDGNLKQDTQFQDVELKLVSADQAVIHSFYPEKVHSFRYYGIPGAGWGLQCKIDITGHFHDILDFLSEHRTTGFSFVIESRQQGLFDGGTRVDMTPEAEPSDPPAETVDRSHENKPRGRGRPRKVTSIDGAEVASAIVQSTIDETEWDKHFNELHAAKEEPAEALI